MDVQSAAYAIRETTAARATNHVAYDIEFVADCVEASEAHDGVWRPLQRGTAMTAEAAVKVPVSDVCVGVALAAMEGGAA